MSGAVLIFSRGATTTDVGRGVTSRRHWCGWRLACEESVQLGEHSKAGRGGVSGGPAASISCARRFCCWKLSTLHAPQEPASAPQGAIQGAWRVGGQNGHTAEENRTSSVVTCFINHFRRRQLSLQCTFITSLEHTTARLIIWSRALPISMIFTCQNTKMYEGAASTSTPTNELMPLDGYRNVREKGRRLNESSTLKGESRLMANVHSRVSSPMVV